MIDAAIAATGLILIVIGAATLGLGFAYIALNISPWVAIGGLLAFLWIAAFITAYYTL